MKMVKSFLTVYVIAFSSAVLLGTSQASTRQTDPTEHHSRRKDTDAAAKTTDERNTTPENPDALQTSPDPPSSSPPPSHPYLALFDPLTNTTTKLDLFLPNPPARTRHRGLGAPSPKPPNGGTAEKIQNFIEWDTLRDSEKEVRIHYNGITAKETIVRTGTDEDTGRRLGLKLRQLTDGKHFIQLIYNFDDEIQDCEYIRQRAVIDKFLGSFRGNVEGAKRAYEGAGRRGEEEDEEYLEDDEGKIEKYSLESEQEQYEGEDVDFGQEYRNVSFQIIRRDADVPKELAEWMNYPRLKRQCRENHKVLKQLAFNRKHGDDLAKKLAEEHIERVKRNLDFSLIFPGTKWCGKSHIAEKYTALGGFSKTDKCCRTHDHCHPLISAFEDKYGLYNFRPFTVSHCRCDLRRKRDLMDVLLVPGTKWCGKGRRATKYTSLGGFSRTDKCCRVHDTMCPHWIGSLEEKYGLFNWRINTIMHCRCDKRFRACLKMAKTGTANFVGKLFFNVVQTKCFVLKPQEVCLKYSWWGKCEKMGYRKKAYLKDNLSY